MVRRRIKLTEALERLKGATNGVKKTAEEIRTERRREEQARRDERNHQGQ